MSLVNDMLRDLERRPGAEPLAGLAAVAEVRPVARRRAGLWLTALAVGALVVTLAVVAWPQRNGPYAPVAESVAVQHEAVSSAQSAVARSATALATPGAGGDTADRPAPAGVPAAASAPTVPVVTPAVPAATLASLRRYRLSYALSTRPRERPRTHARAVADAALATPPPSRPTQPDSVPSVRGDEAVSQPAPAQQYVKTSIDPALKWRREGLRELRAGRPGAAVERFGRLVELDRSDTEAHLLLHRALHAQKRIADAQAALQAALAVASEPSRIAVALAHDLLAAGDAEAARRTLHTHRPSRGSDIDYEALLAAASERAGAYASAREQYALLVELQPWYGAWWVGVGIASEALGRNAEARAAFARAQHTELAPALARYAAERSAALEQAHE